MTNKKFETKDAMSILTIGVVFLVIYVMYKIYLLLKDPFGTDKEEEDLKEDIKYDEKKLTYPKYWYTASAKTLENALLEDPWESETEVSAIMWQIHNDDDISALVEAFGSKELYYAFIPGLESYNLVAAIQTYVPEMVEHYNNHFEGWKMKFRF